MKPDDIAKIMEQKFGFVSSKDTHHRYYELNLSGDIPKIVVYFSHNKKEVGKVIESRMAQEIYVRAKFFREMLSCSKSREDYYQQLRNDPYPPFPPKRDAT